MEWLNDLFLFLHIGSVIVAFGPTIAFPLLAARAQKEPMHGSFVLRASEFISNRVVEPGAVVVFLTGVGVIVTGGWNPFTQLWLATAIVLFLATFTYANLVQSRLVRRMIALASQPPSPDAPAAGPSPEFLDLAAKTARGGQAMAIALFVIVFLMVFKPTF